MVELGKLLVVFLQFNKLEEANQILNKREDPLLVVFWRKPPKMTFPILIDFVTCGLFAANGGLR